MIYSDPAFWVSIISLAIAGASLGWNIGTKISLTVILNMLS